MTLSVQTKMKKGPSKTPDDDSSDYKNYIWAFKFITSHVDKWMSAVDALQRKQQELLLSVLHKLTARGFMLATYLTNRMDHQPHGVCMQKANIGYRICLSRLAIHATPEIFASTGGADDSYARPRRK